MAEVDPEAIRVVIFDVGGVLVESPFTAAVRWGQELDLPMEAFGALYEEYAKVPAPGEPVPLWHQVETGVAPLQDFVDLMQERFAELLPLDHPGRLVTAADFNVFASAQLHESIVSRVQPLRDVGLRVGILTNNVREWADWRAVVPIALFDDVIDSCEVGLRKPDPAIYRLACSRHGVEADSVLFLDDHEGNVDGARAVGMQAALVEADLSPTAALLDGVIASAVSSRGANRDD